MTPRQNVLVTGGAGYVGAVLAPKLLRKGYRVRVLDLYLYGDNVLDSVRDCPALTQVNGDIRDRERLRRELVGIDTVIHLACVSNDPSYELDPVLGHAINADAFPPLVEMAREAGVTRFVLASSSSVYGVRNEPDVTEDLQPAPITDYARDKVFCEECLQESAGTDMAALILRPATLCGYSPRMRLDLTVNILTNLAVNKGAITVFGGEQKRPNLHIEDMTDLYVELLECPLEQIDGKKYNVGYENHTVMELAQIVKRTVGDPQVAIDVSATDDLRSYSISSGRIKSELGYAPRRTIEDAVRILVEAFRAGKIPNPLEDDRYYNVRRMKALHAA